VPAEDDALAIDDERLAEAELLQAGGHGIDGVVSTTNL
jgi:hypothetical protein